jgi:hypothetical protein
MGHSQISSILLLFVSFAYKHDEIPIETVVYAKMHHGKILRQGLNDNIMYT